MKLDYSITLKRIDKIKNILSRENEITIKNLAKKVNLPESTTSLYVNNYLQDICLMKKDGREKRISLANNKISKFENRLIDEKSKIGIARKLRKNGLTYSEIKDKLKDKGFKMGDGTLSKYLNKIRANGEYKDRYNKKIKEDRRNAGKIGGKIRVSMKNFKDFQKLGNFAKNKIAMGRIPESSKNLTKEKIWLIGHCIFDGSVIDKKGCHVIAYTNKSQYLINQFKKNMFKVYKLNPTDLRKREEDIYVIRYCSIAAVRDITSKIKCEIPNFIMNSVKEDKIIFLKTFWDDEGAMHFGITKDKRGFFHININAEGFCDNNRVREQLIKLHKDIDISTISYGKKIRISGRENMTRFKKYLGFSPKIYLSYPKSKFHGWEKRKLLKFALGFKHKNASNLYRDLWMQ